MELVRVVEGGKVTLSCCQVTEGRGLPTAVQVRVTLVPSPASFTETKGVAGESVCGVVRKWGCM